MSDNQKKQRPTENQDASAGAHSLREILSQPECWERCLSELSRGAKVRDILTRYSSATEWIFVGCGSSYYLALSAAASFTALTGKRARAIPASEIVLYPDLVLAGTEKPMWVLISRSGRTSEVLKAAELLASQGRPTLAIGCAEGQPLERLATDAIILPTDEESMVMTRSYTSMLLSLQFLAAQSAGKTGFVDALKSLPSAVNNVLEDLSGRVQSFVDSHDFADYVALGQGPFFGIAAETALKVTEMSCSYAQTFHTMEFRHGPKSIVSPETLIIFLLSEKNYQPEREVLEEMKGLGGTTLVVTNHADPATKRCSDFLIELSTNLPELALLSPYLFAGQLLGLHTGLKKGLDPDQPRNLSRVVILDA